MPLQGCATEPSASGSETCRPSGRRPGRLDGGGSFAAGMPQGRLVPGTAGVGAASARRSRQRLFTAPGGAVAAPCSMFTRSDGVSVPSGGWRCHRVGESGVGGPAAAGRHPAGGETLERRAPAVGTRRPRACFGAAGSRAGPAGTGVASAVACWGGSQEPGAGSRERRFAGGAREWETGTAPGSGCRPASRRKSSWLCLACCDWGRVDLEHAAGFAGGGLCVGGPRKDAPLPTGRCRCKACPALHEEDPRP